MGECADDTVTTLRINEETASHTDVRAALNGYFAARRNTIVERARFNTRKQIRHTQRPAHSRQNCCRYP